MTDIYQLPQAAGQLPPPVGVGGYVYAVEFTDGTVKVGTTVEPGKRIAKHARDGAAFGAIATRAWVSPQHDGAYRTETDLMLIANSLSTGVRRREYFVDCPFADVVNAARRLPFPPVVAPTGPIADPDRLVNAAKKIFALPVDEPGRMFELVGRLFGRVEMEFGLPDLGAGIPFKDVCRIADALDVTADSVLQMSLLDIQLLTIRHLVDSEARLQALHARANGHVHLFEPIHCPDLPDEEDEAPVAVEHGSLRPTTSMERTRS
jgi:hypothetical protein